MITNRKAARAASAQIGRSYQDLSGETKRFISENFKGCDYQALAQLCDEIAIGHGLYLRLDDFEKKFFPLADRIASRVPLYTHVSISTWGLKFEFPEHHFLRDLESGIANLKDTKTFLGEFRSGKFDAKKQHTRIATLVAREKFLSRSITSAAFSLVEAFLSGLFFTAVQTEAIGLLRCDEAFLKYAQTKESAPLRDRLDRTVQFTSRGAKSGNDDPFNSFIKVGKHYRDAIHHTAPFGRKDVEQGGRLVALYEIDARIALRCAVLSCETVLAISRSVYGDREMTDISARCGAVSKEALDLQGQVS